MANTDENSLTNPVIFCRKMTYTHRRIYSNDLVRLVYIGIIDLSSDFDLGNLPIRDQIRQPISFPTLIRGGLWSDSTNSYIFEPRGHFS